MYHTVDAVSVLHVQLTHSPAPHALSPRPGCVCKRPDAACLRVHALLSLNVMAVEPASKCTVMPAAPAEQQPAVLYKDLQVQQRALQVGLADERRKDLPHPARA